MFQVLLVDDEKIVLNTMKEIVPWETYHSQLCGVCSSAMEALEIIRRERPDIVVTDVKMPRMDGVEMIAKLRENGCQAKFIILTAYSDFKYAQSALRLGVSDYLLKPLKDGELELVVRRIQGQEEALESKAAKEQDMPVFRLNPVKNTKNKYVEQAVQLIREHFREDINISTVAGELEISEGYLSRVFKKETDYTFTSYLTRYRMKKAMSLLKDCRVKVYEVAEQVGYSDTAYFSAQFKKLIGISPSEYQDRSR
mgnify:CR=1 FL=1